MPVLSIILPVYNSEKFIRETVQSLLNQTFTDFELIIIDDGSTDKSLEVIYSIKDERISVLTNPVNKGIVYSRNLGLREARGLFIAPFDADDIAEPHKFEKQIVFLNSKPEFGMIGSWVKLIDADGNDLNRVWRLNGRPESIPSQLLFRNYFAQSAVVMRKEVMENLYYDDSFAMCEDYMMWINISRKWQVWNYPEYLTYVRIHEGSTTYQEKNLLPFYEAKVYRFLFSPLGLILDQLQIELLLLIKGKKPITDYAILRKIEQFLIIIFEANQKNKIFDSHQLTMVLFDRWLKVCFKSKKITVMRVFLFVRSPIVRNYATSYFRS